MATDQDHPSGEDLELSPPLPVLAVRPEEAERDVVVGDGVAARIDAMVATFVEDVLTLDPHGDEYRRRIADIDGLGQREILATSEMSRRLLDHPTRAVSAILGSKAPIARNLVSLRRAVDELDPSRYDFARSATRASYFDRYAKAHGHIEAIVGALDDSRGELLADSAALAQEERALWTEMETLRQYAYLTRALDQAIERRLQALAVADGPRAQALRADVLYPIRQRLRDILLQLAVATQGYAALRVVQQNDTEVIRAIQTATTTTTAALRTAVLVAGALADQRVILERLRAVNSATNGIIDRTAALGRAQASEVEAQITRAAADLMALQRAWDDVFTTLDQIDVYKSSALATMQVTVRELSGQVERSRAHLEQLGSRPVQGSGLRLP
ncbi:MAG: toxic anion resistance protein [Candidatus Limnocylindrales bacterium]